MATVCIGCSAEGDSTAGIDSIATVTSGADCIAATKEATDTMDAVLDRAEVDPGGIDSDALETIAFDLGTSLGTLCSEAQVGEALSTLITYLSNQAPLRSSTAQSMIAGILEGICPLSADFDVTPAAQVACA